MSALTLIIVIVGGAVFGVAAVLALAAFYAAGVHLGKAKAPEPSDEETVALIQAFGRRNGVVYAPVDAALLQRIDGVQQGPAFVLYRTTAEGWCAIDFRFLTHIEVQRIAGAGRMQ